jgi:hypothetical protein
LRVIDQKIGGLWTLKWKVLRYDYDDDRLYSTSVMYPFLFPLTYLSTSAAHDKYRLLDDDRPTNWGTGMAPLRPSGFIQGKSTKMRSGMIN